MFGKVPQPQTSNQIDATMKNLGGRVVVLGFCLGVSPVGVGGCQWNVLWPMGWCLEVEVEVGCSFGCPPAFLHQGLDGRCLCMTIQGMAMSEAVPGDECVWGEGVHGWLLIIDMGHGCVQ